MRYRLDWVQRGSDAEERHPFWSVHQRPRGDQRHQGRRLPALRGGDDDDVVHLGVDDVHPLGVFLGKVLDAHGKDHTRILAVVDPPRLTAEALHKRIRRLADLKGR